MSETTIIAKPEQRRLAKMLHEKRQAEIARFVADEKARIANQRVEPTLERVNKGDIALRPVRDGLGGVVTSRTYSKRLEIGQLGKNWVPSIQNAFELFAKDAAVLEVQNVTMNYDRAGGATSAHNRIGGVGESKTRREAADRNEYIMRKLHTFDAIGEVSIVVVLNFVLCHVENARLGKQNPKTWADVGRLLEPGYEDDTTARAHARSAIKTVGRFMAGAYLEYFAMYGSVLRRRDDARAVNA
jgi:hypothetical protein